MKDATDYAVAARALLASRRKMEQFFPELFADPARDMLLDLFVAAEEGREMSVTSCCVAAMVPATTALRWLSLLKEQGLVLEEPDKRDRRQKLLHLAPYARAQMREFIDTVAIL
jgi:DNA-binding MarR family transcriptional regulator